MYVLEMRRTKHDSQTVSDIRGETVAHLISRHSDALADGLRLAAASSREIRRSFIGWQQFE